ncbi:alpha/beta fold hydrolase [Streptomyces sp. V2I9]|uniref:alpha/beta fold hydrolase n=1 Tax=Streptomyces sp. V2I9 TaxID=3042304 RepID=UPI00278A70C6|nr:thioesterase domain-containing protein [Streptomyces sp. V2I9]MDQ0987946.1 surfactin synthase thioesterase subunit [Streptomyces sp. V2I9]
MALAGGVNIELPHRVGYYHQDGSIWSADGSCRPFDADAGGTITASGAGAVVIKRLDQALADGDAVHAVIRGSALNNDGNRKVGFTAPSVAQQSRVIRAALANAGVDRREIGYLEAHGTATAIGDVVEWAAIEQALGPDGVPCALGATKANLGHLGAAAGILGVIKATLVLAHGRIPPVANFRERNPQIRPKSDRLFVPEDCGPWESEKPRLAGVSSMGVGGTNAHVVLEEPPVAEPVEESGELVAVLPVSAASERSAQDTAERVARFAAEHPGRLGALAHTLATGRQVLPHREAVVAVRRDGGVTTWRTGSRLAKRKLGHVLVLPGQGQPAGDLTGAAAGIDGFADLLAEALQALPAEDRTAVGELLSGAPAGEAEPRLGELALLVQSVVIGRSLLADGLRPSALCGFSLGELAAGVLAGVFDLGEAATVISERARILRDAPPGGMIRVRLTEEALAPYLSEAVSLAIVPGARDCMLSGEATALDALMDRLRGDRLAAVRVPVAHPYHSTVLTAAKRFICLGYCGGGVSSYMKWAGVLPPGVELAAVCYPGREGRFVEDFARGWEELVEDVITAVVSASDLPYVLFGHSMGSWVAFDVASRLEERGHRGPEALVLSSANAPSVRLDAGEVIPSQAQSDDQLRDWMRHFGLLPQHVLDDADLQEMAVELMHADIRVRDSFRFRPGSGVTAPVELFTGTEDETIDPDVQEQWRKLAGNGLRHTELPGSHFYTPAIWDVLPSHISSLRANAPAA